MAYETAQSERANALLELNLWRVWCQQARHVDRLGASVHGAEKRKQLLNQAEPSPPDPEACAFHCL